MKDKNVSYLTQAAMIAAKNKVLQGFRRFPA